MPPPERYHLAATEANVKACIAAIRPLYEHFTPIDIAEAIYQIRKELNQVADFEAKTKRIRTLEAELADLEK